MNGPGNSDSVWTSSHIDMNPRTSSTNLGGASGPGRMENSNSFSINARYSAGFFVM